MGRLLACCLALSSFTASELIRCYAGEASAPIPVRISESKPVVVNDAKFVVVAQTEWQPGKPDRSVPIVVPIDIQLRITNLSDKDMLFATKSTFGIKILDANGKEMKSRVAGEGKTSTGPVLISGGGSYSLCRKALLQLIDHTKASELIYLDGTGSKSIIGPLNPGRYKLFFWYEVKSDKRDNQKGDKTATWRGKVFTEEVQIQLLDGTSGFGGAEDPDFLSVSSKLVRIHESKPVTVNEAKFVVVAAGNWTAGKKSTPIDIQLHITNLSKKDLEFRTFDAFEVILREKDGKRINPTSGRDGAMSFTRPVVIGKSASYALCRRAEISWNAEAKRSWLIYWDGTGSFAEYGPLSNDNSYKLSFRYGPVKIKTKPKNAEPWLGVAETSELLIKLVAE